MVSTHIPTADELKAMDFVQFKTVENRLRAGAARQGLQLEKSRSRDPRAIDYGTYDLIDQGTGGHAADFGFLSGYGLTLDQVAWFLLSDPPTIILKAPDDPADLQRGNGHPLLSYQAADDGWVLWFEGSWCYANRDTHKRPVPRHLAGANAEDYIVRLDEDQTDEAIKEAQQYLRRIGYREP